MRFQKDENLVVILRIRLSMGMHSAPMHTYLLALLISVQNKCLELTFRLPQCADQSFLAIGLAHNNENERLCSQYFLLL